MEKIDPQIRDNSPNLNIGDGVVIDGRAWFNDGHGDLAISLYKIEATICDIIKDKRGQAHLVLETEDGTLLKTYPDQVIPLEPIE